MTKFLFLSSINQTLRRGLSALSLLFLLLPAPAQTLVRENPQHTFKQIPAGNYSGICKLDGDRYAVVSDKSPDGFFIFHIDIDSVSGDISSVESLGFRPSGMPGRDQEGIAYIPSTGKILICGEADNLIYEYDTTGMRSPRHYEQTEGQRNLTGSYGLESLTYNETTRLIWTCNENQNDSIWLQSYDEQGLPGQSFLYLLDPAEADHPGSIYAHGVSELCALDDGTLLVLEREFYVPPGKVGAWVQCKLYATDLQAKRLVHSWKTRLSLLSWQLANYEGMCVARRLAPDRLVLLLVSDSQDQYGGVLKDWFKTIVIQTNPHK